MALYVPVPGISRRTGWPLIFVFLDIIDSDENVVEREHRHIDGQCRFIEANEACVV